MTFNTKKSDFNITRYLFNSVLLMAVYFLLAIFSSYFTPSTGIISPFFLPAGYAVSIIIIFGVRYWPVIFITKFLWGLTIYDNHIYNILGCLGSTSEVYIGHYLYHSFKLKFEEKYQYQSKVFLVGIVSFLAPILSTFVGVTKLFDASVDANFSYVSNFLTWYLGDALSIAILLPLFLDYIEAKENKLRLLDFISPLIAFCLVYLLSFNVLIPYLVLIFLGLLIPFAFGSNRGIYFSTIVIALVLNYFFRHQIGPFSKGNFSTNLISLQIFLFSISLTAITLDGFKKTGLIKTALFPLISIWSLTGISYYYYYSQKDFENEKIVHNLISNFENRAIEKIGYYEFSTKAAAGFISGSIKIENDEWNSYVKSISIVDHNKGIRGLGIIYPNKVSVYPEHLNDQKQFEGLINNTYLKEYFNQTMYRLTAVLTPAINFDLGNNEKTAISFLIVPAKKNNQFVAWIVMPLEMEYFFKSIIETYNQSIDIDVYDGEKNYHVKRIYSKDIQSKIKIKEDSYDLSNYSTIVLADRLFTLDWKETLRYVTIHNSENSFIIFLGITFSLIVTGFILNLRLLGLKANQKADKKSIELKESEERFKSLFENSSDAVVLFNAHQIIDCNPKSQELFGKRSKKELIETPLYEFFAIRDLYNVDDKNLFRNKVHEVRHKKMVKFECFCLRGTLPFFAEMHLHYIGLNDHFIYQAVIRDISERKKIEQNLTKSKELAEDAARAKSNFLSTMSHEIRTPLNGIIGMINIIIDENPKIDIREDLETIKYSADNLLHIVNEVLDFTKIESGKVVLEHKAFSLRELCEKVIKIHRPKALEKNLDLKFEVDSKTPDIVVGDEYRNIQIINNLLSNALKFTEEGEVLLQVRLKQKKTDSCLIEFKIIDTGIGIDKANQREIFKDFTQAQSDHARKYGGTGLGLAITKKLVEIQQGKIDVQSELNKGTTFTYSIQFQTQAEIPMNTAPISSEKAQETFKGQRVLLVEDNQVNIIVTKKFLEKWGLKVDVAINGLEAVNHVRAITYSIILMDLHMPLMDGFEATKKIREFNKETPIIGLSADVMTESASSLQSIGMNDFVTKPFRPNDFFSKLKSYLQ